MNTLDVLLCHSNLKKIKRTKMFAFKLKLLFTFQRICFDLTGNQPNSLQKEMHYSWDYAQQVHYPHHAMQVGPIYFRTPRKSNVFGICSEASGKEYFFEYIFLSFNIHVVKLFLSDN